MTDLTPILRFVLLLVRPGMVVMTAPALGGNQLSPHVKVGLTVLIAFGLLPSVQVPVSSSEVSLTVMIAREVAIGMALALVVRALIGAAEFAGHLSGFQMGFSYGATVDPSSGVRHTMLATLYGLMATLTFLGINGHHALLRALGDSFTRLPIGTGHVDESLLTAVGRIFALLFTVGLRLAAPAVVVLLLVELGIGLISRTAPALSSMVIGAPLRVIIGLVVVAAVIATVPGVVSSVLERTIRLAIDTAGAFR